MKDFKSIIGGNYTEVKNVRINNVTNQIKDESEMIIRKLKNDYRKLQNEIEEALDLGPENSTDLGTNLKKVNPSQLLTKIYNNADEMSVLSRQIKIRVQIHNILFPENKIEELSNEELDFLVNLV